MAGIKERLKNLDWERIAVDMNTGGHAVVPDFLSAGECDKILRRYDKKNGFRKTVNMERYRFGLGEYKYFSYPLPAFIQEIREKSYPHISPIANEWMEKLKLEKRFPDTHEKLQVLCRANNQTESTVVFLRYRPGGFNTLHQDLYGDVYFPIQLVLFLNQPELDYTGGAFVLTEQRPRAQSKAHVLQPEKGDMLLFTTSTRPVAGAKGYYRVNMRHGVSEILSGERHALGIIFHDAAR